MDSKKIKAVVPMIIMVSVLVVLAVSGSYAYFTLNVQNEGGTTTSKVNTGVVGSSSLLPGKNMLLNLTRELMMMPNSDKSLYATEDGTPSTSETKLSIASAKVVGEGVMNCNYTLNVDITGTMYDKIKVMANNSNQLILNIDGTDYDIVNDDLTNGISGVINGVSSSVSKNIMASFRFVNKKEVSQNDLKDTNITLGFTVKEFVCVVAS